MFNFLTLKPWHGWALNLLVNKRLISNCVILSWRRRVQTLRRGPSVNNNLYQVSRRVIFMPFLINFWCRLSIILGNVRSVLARQF